MIITGWKYKELNDVGEKNINLQRILEKHLEGNQDKNHMHSRQVF